MKPRATFVIPAFNAERWISKAIWSCRNQTIKQIEIIVVDDCSTDWTNGIATKHAQEDKRVTVMKHPANMGRSFARNNGNERAQSDIILVLDADDMSARNRVKDTLAAFELKKADLVYGSFHVMDSLGNVHSRIPSSPFNADVSTKSKLNYICHSTVAYTKKLAMDVQYTGGDFCKLGLDDWKFQWDAYRKGYKFANVKSPLAYYRNTEDGVSSVRDESEVMKAKEAYLHG